jgi:PadR family transcriptional regulator, regulatory protein PadR
MSTQDAYAGERDTLLQGTLDLLILRILALASHHGQGIARVIQFRSGDTLLVDHGSLYPALQRLENRGWIKGAWGTSENNRRARFYSLTPLGRKQFLSESGRWNRLVESIARVLSPDPLEG